MTEKRIILLTAVLSYGIICYVLGAMIGYYGEKYGTKVQDDGQDKTEEEAQGSLDIYG